MDATQNVEAAESKPLVNRPEAKIPSLPKGARIHKRPLPGLVAGVQRNLNKSRSNAPASALSSTATASDNTGFDVDGYRSPQRATHTVVIKVNSSTPFMATIKRVRTALDAGPQKTKGLPFMQRMSSLGVRDNTAANQSLGTIADALEDVVLVATGRAIPKALEAGAFLMRNKELLVVFRTRTISAIDDIVADDDEVDVEDHARVRHVSCVEVGIRWKK